MSPPWPRSNSLPRCSNPTPRGWSCWRQSGSNATGSSAITPRQLAAALPLAATGVPVAAGLLATVALALGATERGTDWSTAAFITLLEHPSFWTSTSLSLWTAWGSTLLAFSTAVCLGYWLQQGKQARIANALLPALLSIPHAAFAVGFFFLISPSGWLARLLSPWLTGWDRPPDIASVQDPLGIALMLGLAIKETPFLLLTLLAALGQSNHNSQQWLGRSLGYSPWRCWLTLTVPLLYRQMRLPLLVVLGYGLSVVDMAKILGPSIPATLAVQSTAWLHDADSKHWPLGAASALTLVLMALISVAVWRALEHWGKPLARHYWLSGRRTAPCSEFIARWLLPPAWAVGLLASCAVIALWSVTWRWRFPDAWPSSFTLVFWWRNADQILWPAWHTLSLGLGSTAVSLLAAIALLESTPRFKPIHLACLYAPLLLPQLAFLFGVQLLLLQLHADGRWWAIVWTHALFVFPYTVITLYGPWQAYDKRYSQIGLALGKSKLQVWWSIKRPLLSRPLCFSAALGFSVSVAQYLSTLFVGAGRFPTLTTEAIALSAGGDRRALAAVAFVQMALPLLAYSLAFAFSRGRFPKRSQPEPAHAA